MAVWRRPNGGLLTRGTCEELRHRHGTLQHQGAQRARDPSAKSRTNAVGTKPKRSAASKDHAAQGRRSLHSVFKSLPTAQVPPAAQDYRSRTMTANLLHKPAFATFKGDFVYGQVVSAKGRVTTIRTPSGKTVTTTAKVDEVAPVICLLLHNAGLSTGTTPRPRAVAIHGKILDRLLGLNGEGATREIAQLLTGLVPDHQPEPSSQCSWIDPDTEGQVSFSLQHAIDFAHFVDGERPIPRHLRASIGSTFMDEPPTGIEPVDPPVHAQRRPASSQSPALDALLSAFNEEPDQLSPPAKQTDDSAIQAELVALIANKPHILQFYFKQCVDNAVKRAATDDVDGERAKQRPRQSPDQQRAWLDSYSIDSVDDRGRHKDSFYPSSSRRSVSAGVIAPQYLGKSPSELIDIMMSSPATEFNPLPSVTGRLWDLLFDIHCGVSIAYLIRFDKSQRRQWRRNKRVNMNNRSATVDLPEVPHLNSLNELRDNLSVLDIFAQEFYNAITRDFVRAALDFATQLASVATWNSSDMDELVEWFDDAFVHYRRAVEEWVSTGVDRRAEARKRFSKSDPGFLLMLFNITSNRSSHMQREAPSRAGDKSRGLKNDNASATEQSNIKTPAHVLALVPRSNGKAICMKYLSANSCPSKSKERCKYHNLAHDLPTKKDIDPVVENYITKHMGGLRSDLA